MLEAVLGPVISWSKFLLQKSGQMLEQAAREGGWVIVPGHVEETFRCCTKEHGLVGRYW